MSKRNEYIVVVKRAFRDETSLSEIFKETGVNAILSNEEKMRAIVSLTRDECRAIERNGKAFVEERVEFGTRPPAPWPSPKK